VDPLNFKQITIGYLYDNFDGIMDDIEMNKSCYQVDIGNSKAVMVLPCDVYDLLLDVHKQIN
jgi:hypothetical protein